MDPEEAQRVCGVRFASDLKQIREKRGLSLDNVLDELKVPRGLLEHFERTALLDHEMFNRVYLRSFVRSYAQVVGLPVEEALAALEEVFEGRYLDRLAEKYLGIKREEAPPEVAAGEDAGMPSGPVSGEEEPVPAPPAEEPAAETTREPEQTVVPERARAVRAGRLAGAGPHRRRQAEEGLWLRIVLGGALVVVLVLVAYFFLLRSEPPPAEEAPAPVPEDTVAAEVPPPPPPPPVLPDTMTVYLVAERGPLLRIRVRVDDDLRRPYWVEQGDSILFRPVNRISIQSRYSLPRARITLEGHTYPVSPSDTMVVISRETARAFLETLPR